MSRKLIIIGTLHADITPNNELREIIESYKPDQVLVEMADEDIKNNNLGSYPSEMVFAYDWAKNNNIQVNGFDSKINVFKEGVVPADNQALIEKQRMLIRKLSLSWKDFNKPENEKLLDVDGIDKIVDNKSDKAREMEMLKNVNNVIVKNGTVLVITGVGHLDFFKRNLKKAILPFYH